MFNWFRKLINLGVEPSGVRARDSRGRFVADYKSTPNVNEAYADGKTPTKKRGRGRPKGSKNKKK